MQSKIKVMLADDEEMALNMLKNIIPWEDLRLKPAGTARDGLEMLHLLEKTEADIIITDIRMPNMDGLEMVRRIKADKPDIKIILSSAFADFAFVKEGLKLGCSDYLLKPVDEKELLKALHKIIGEIEGEKDEKKRLEHSKKRLFFMDLYKYMCTGKLTEGEEEESAYASFLQKDYIVLYIHKDYADFEEYLHTTSIEMFKEDFVEAVLGEIVQSRIGRDYVFFDYDEEGWIMILKNCSHEDMPDICARISAQLREKLQLPVHQYFSMVGNTREDLPLCFRQVKRMQKYSFSFAEQEYLGYNYNCDGEKLEKIRDLDRSRQVQSDALSPAYSKTVEKSLAYIRSHYKQNLSLEEICSHVAVSKNYFCYLFKREVGVSLWNYLTKIRLEQAKKLLEESEMKTYEISDAVGYDNPNYFSKVFKKFCHMSPNEYRRQQGLSV